MRFILGICVFIGAISLIIFLQYRQIKAGIRLLYQWAHDRNFKILTIKPYKLNYVFMSHKRPIIKYYIEFIDSKNNRISANIIVGSYLDGLKSRKVELNVISEEKTIGLFIPDCLLFVQLPAAPGEVIVRFCQEEYGEKMTTILQVS